MSSENNTETEIKVNGKKYKIPENIPSYELSEKWNYKYAMDVDTIINESKILCDNNVLNTICYKGVGRKGDLVVYRSKSSLRLFEGILEESNNVLKKSLVESIFHELIGPLIHDCEKYKKTNLTSDVSIVLQPINSPNVNYVFRLYVDVVNSPRSLVSVIHSNNIAKFIFDNFKHQILSVLKEEKINDIRKDAVAKSNDIRKDAVAKSNDIRKDAVAFSNDSTLFEWCTRAKSVNVPLKIDDVFSLKVVPISKVPEERNKEFEMCFIQPPNFIRAKHLLKVSVNIFANDALLLNAKTDNSELLYELMGNVRFTRYLKYKMYDLLKVSSIKECRYIYSHDIRQGKEKQKAYSKLRKLLNVYDTSLRNAGSVYVDMKLPGYEELILYYGMNENPKMNKLSVFDPMIDGYFSYANEVVNIYKSSAYFTLTKYEGQQAYYQKHFDYYLKISKGYPVTLLTKYLEDEMESGTATPSTFLVIYFIVMSYVDNDITGKKRTIVKEPNSYKEIVELVNKEKSLARLRVPMITPKGLYGINTFLYCFFNGLYPIGVTTTPYKVHGIEVGKSPIKYMQHDLDHYNMILYNGQVEHKIIYNYIVSNQEKFGIDKCKGLLTILFFQVHEGYGPGLDESLRLMKLYWYDWWNFIVKNTYYNEERLGVTIPRSHITYNHQHSINIYDCKDESFKIARVNDRAFYTAVETYPERFIEVTYRDLIEIKKLLGLPLLPEDEELLD